MEIDGFTHALGMILQVFLLDLILSGDNALIIALACRRLPEHLRRRAVLIGTGAAIGLRALLALIISVLLSIPLLKIIGGAALVWIAIKLLLGDDEAEAAGDGAGGIEQLWSAVAVVVTADLVLSLDNVVALAAAAQGSPLYLVLGLLMSVPLIMYGSLFVGRLLDAHPLMVPAGSALLAWLGGQMAVDDPLVADWVATQSPALTVVVPALCVVFVLIESRIIRERRERLVAPPPLGLVGALAGRLTRLGEAEPDEPAPAQAASPRAEPRPPAVAPDAKPSAATRVETAPVAVAERPTDAAPAPVRRAPPRRAAEPDPVQQSPGLSLALKIAIGCAATVAVVVLLWMGFHLASQGLLPAPAHPHGHGR